jgi:hypothetical protein
MEHINVFQTGTAVAVTAVTMTVVVCRVSPAPHLAPSSLQRLVSDECVGDLELDVADGLVTQRSLTSTPLEALWVF